jgi:hypothetical protein
MECSIFLAAYLNLYGNLEFSSQNLANMSHLFHEKSYIYVPKLDFLGQNSPKINEMVLSDSLILF